VDIFLDALKKSVSHLQIIDNVLSNENYPEATEYQTIKQKIVDLNKKIPNSKFTDLLYVGGKKSGKKGFHRHMILSDLMEYIFFGRGHYFIDGDIDRKKVFIEILLNTINLLMIMDSLTVEVKLRKKVLEELESNLGADFFKNNDMKLLHEALKKHQGTIGFDAREEDLSSEVDQIINNVEGDRKNWKKLDDYYDSLLPKTGGGLWNELIVFFYLLRRTSVYILPLLLIQRVFSKDDMLKPPDYLVIDKKKNLFGIEVGGGKETQSGNFASKTGATMVTTQNTNVPPRCPICGKWNLFCPKVISDCSDIEKNPLLRIKKEVRCAHECDLFSKEDVIEGKCPYIQYHGEVSEDTINNSQQKIKFSSNYHYHYSCIRAIKDSKALEKIQNQTKADREGGRWGITVLKTDYPYVSGIDVLEKLDRHDIVCYGNFPNPDPKNCDACKFKSDCEKLTKTLSMIDSVPLSETQKDELKRTW